MEDADRVERIPLLMGYATDDADGEDNARQGRHWKQDGFISAVVLGIMLFALLFCLTVSHWLTQGSQPYDVFWAIPACTMSLLLLVAIGLQVRHLYFTPKPPPADRNHTAAEAIKKRMTDIGRGLFVLGGICDIVRIIAVGNCMKTFWQCEWVIIANYVSDMLFRACRASFMIVSLIFCAVAHGHVFEKTVEKRYTLMVVLVAALAAWFEFTAYVSRGVLTDYPISDNDGCKARFKGQQEHLKCLNETAPLFQTSDHVTNYFYPLVTQFLLLVAGFLLNAFLNMKKTRREEQEEAEEEERRREREEEVEEEEGRDREEEVEEEEGRDGEEEVGEEEGRDGEVEAEEEEGEGDEGRVDIDPHHLMVRSVSCDSPIELQPPDQYPAVESYLLLPEMLSPTVFHDLRRSLGEEDNFRNMFDAIQNKIKYFTENVPIVPGGANEPGVVPGGANGHGVAPGGANGHGVVQGGANEPGVVPGGANDPGLVPGGANDHGVVPGGANDLGVVPGGANQPGLVPGGANDHGVVPGGANDHGVVPGGANDHGVVPGGANDHGVEPGGANDHVVVPGGANDHGVAPGGANDHGVVPGGANQPGLVPGGANDHGVAPGGANDHGVVPGEANDHGVAPEGANDHGVVPGGANQPGLVPGGANDHGVAPGGANDHGVVPGGANDHGVAPGGAHQPGLVPGGANDHGVVQGGANQPGLVPAGANGHGVVQGGANQPGLVPAGANGHGVIPGGANHGVVPGGAIGPVVVPGGAMGPHEGARVTSSPLLVLVVIVLFVYLTFGFLTFKDDPEKHEFQMSYIFLVYEILFMMLIIVLCAIGFYTSREYSSLSREYDGYEIVLILTTASHTLYLVFTVIALSACFDNTHPLPHLAGTADPVRLPPPDLKTLWMLLCHTIATFLESTLQTAFLLHASNLSRPKREGNLYCLILVHLTACNCAIWMIDSVPAFREVDTFGPVQRYYYGEDLWNVLYHMAIPVAIFHRFSSFLIYLRVTLENLF